MTTIIGELASLRYWCTWNWVWDEEKGKWKKPPLSLDGKYLSTSEPGEWLSYEQVEALERKGFLLTPEDGLTAWDLDNCRDPETGVIDDWAMEIVEQMLSYTEVSPSGTGLRIIAIGELDDDHKNVFYIEGHKVEIYDRDRYVTLTGNCVEGLRYNQKLWIGDFLRDVVYLPSE